MFDRTIYAPLMGIWIGVGLFTGMLDHHGLSAGAFILAATYLRIIYEQ